MPSGFLDATQVSRNAAAQAAAMPMDTAGTRSTSASSTRTGKSSMAQLSQNRTSRGMSDAWGRLCGCEGAGHIRSCVEQARARRGMAPQARAGGAGARGRRPPRGPRGGRAGRRGRRRRRGPPAAGYPRAAPGRLGREAAPPLLDLPALLLDLPRRPPLEERFVARLRGPVLAVAPSADAVRIARALGTAARPLAEPATTSLARVQQRLFVEGTDAMPPLGDDVLLLSAPGESRECVEIARLVRREAERGIPFDRMAVLLRAPGQYRPLLEEAFARAGIPAHFASGTQQPNPAGRAFLALLACAADGLSARRFAEYLSLGEVPQAVSGAPPDAPPSGDRWVPPDSELTARPAAEPAPAAEPGPPADLDAPVVAGALRAPWRWEQLLIDAAVIGGRQRWKRRLDGLEAQLRATLAAFAEDEARAQRMERELADLAALREFALPLLDALAALPASASWAGWIDPLTALATRALREPARVLSLLAELAPMGPVGPVSLGEVRVVLGRRLTELSVPPSGKRHGKVFIAPVAAARGLSFDSVFVPGLAEKLFPQKVMEDPLLDRKSTRLNS